MASFFVDFSNKVKVFSYFLPFDKKDVYLQNDLPEHLDTVEIRSHVKQIKTNSMPMNSLIKKVATVGRLLATTAFCLLAITFTWNSSFFSNTTAMASPNVNLIANADQVKGKVNEDTGRTKNFIDDAADKVKSTAKKNASKVEDATDSNGGSVERKARQDAATIQRRADEDASRTKKAVDKTKNAVERTVDNIKDTFSK